MDYQPYQHDQPYQQYREIDPSTKLISEPDQWHPDVYSRAKKEDPPRLDRPARFRGWRFGVRLSAICAAFAFIVNTAWTIWGIVKTHPFDNGDGLGTMFDGDCTQARRLDLWIHLAINALSTLLLGASNYTQQSLVAPTRAEVDRAHQRQAWLDIGTPSMKNLGRIDPGRVFLWVLLSLSSIPLHLLYNSCVFSTISAVSYNVNVTTYNMFEKSPAFTNATWVNLTNSDCISAFGRQLVSSWAEVVVVVSADTNVTAVAANNPWMCTERCSTLPDANSWSLTLNDGSSASVVSCYARPAAQHCQVQFIPSLMAVVIVCNAVKAICIAISFRRKSWSRSLVTVGDAVSSFLENPDPTTLDACLVSKKPFKWKINNYGPWPLPWKAERKRWFRAASAANWIVSHILYIATIIGGSILLALGIGNISSVESTSFIGMWNNGFGTADLNQLINFAGYSYSLIPMILLANTPQVVVSFLYIFFNGLLTSMLLEREWNSFGVKRQRLRVSNPGRKQRSSHFLSLPKLYAIPLMILFAFLHWCLSQAIFLVRVNYYDINNQIINDAGISTCGYSNIAIISAIVIGSIGVLVCFANGFRRFKPGIPLAAGCSAVISAACHRPGWDSHAALEEVKWGMVQEASADTPGHCCITSTEVKQPVEGQLYA